MRLKGIARRYGKAKALAMPHNAVDSSDSLLNNNRNEWSTKKDPLYIPETGNEGCSEKVHLLSSKVVCANGRAPTGHYQDTRLLFEAGGPVGLAPALHANKDT